MSLDPLPDDSPRHAPAAARAPLFDPELIPHDPAFDHPAARGAAVRAEALARDALRARFARPPPWTPELRTDGRWRSPELPPRPAAVLVPLVARADRLDVLLTRRTAHLHDHAGQISFPGGRVDATDRDAVHTALREAQEETGLPADAVEILGALPQYVTATGYAVTPVVGLVERPFALRLDTFEVAEAFEVPLSFLMDPANHERRRIVFDGAASSFYAMPWTQAQRRYFIWGATAAMLRNLYHLLRA
ncbi:MAG: CoA pyrophosphatase [Burkholderiaceae bacterium]|jgi:8-oxo-dGTP pyrophosphatase MutT (NUDIX family)|nr:CoA pyrophosphatase [Burkholderiaceae bacterium]